MGRALHHRPLQGFDSRHAAIEAVGGLFVADPDADPDIIRAEIATRGVRALAVPAPMADLGFLEGLDLEFLLVSATNVDVAPVHSCRSLRALALDSWTGVLDPAGLPELEWFSVTEVEPGQLEQLTGPGHGRLRHLSVGRYRHGDLGALSSLPRLMHLEIIDSRALSSLAGLGTLRELQKLELAACRGLATLEDLSSAPKLVSLVLDNCNQIDDLGVVSALPGLRALKIDIRRPPSLLPLTGHPSLEYVWLVGGRRPDEELIALLDNPAMILVQSSRRMWMRHDGAWEHVANVYEMSPDQMTRSERLHRGLWELMAW